MFHLILTLKVGATYIVRADGLHGTEPAIFKYRLQWAHRLQPGDLCIRTARLPLLAD